MTRTAKSTRRMRTSSDGEKPHRRTGGAVKRANHRQREKSRRARASAFVHGAMVAATDRADIECSLEIEGKSVISASPCTMGKPPPSRKSCRSAIRRARRTRRLERRPPSDQRRAISKAANVGVRSLAPCRRPPTATGQRQRTTKARRKNNRSATTARSALSRCKRARPGRAKHYPVQRLPLANRPLACYAWPLNKGGRRARQKRRRDDE